jgi:hypothetical protein
MLGSFHLYPTASLLTELVQIFQGKYIVKASLQIEGVTRVTGMAAAEILEDAEDRARERVITLFGEVPNTQPQSTVLEVAKPDIAAAISADTSNTPKPFGQAEAPRQEQTPTESLNHPNTQRQPEGISEIVVATTAQLTEPTLPKIDVVTSTAAIEKEIAPVTEPLEVISSKPEVVAITEKHSVPTPEFGELKEVAPVKTTATINAIKTSDVTLPEAISQATIAFDSTPEVSIAPAVNQEISQASRVKTKPEPIPEPLFDPPLENFVPSEIQPELPLAAVAPPSNVTPFVPRNYNPPAEIGIPDVPATTSTTKRTKKTTQPKDNSDDIAKIAVEMERLRWTIEQGRDYLFQTYRKKSRHSLSDDELRNFREYLESQPTPTDDPLAIDPIAGF